MKGIKEMLSRTTIMVVFFLVCCTSCDKAKVLSPTAYLSWMNDPDNGMVKQKEIDGLVYEVRYMTPEQMTLNELKKTNVEPAEFEKVRKTYGNMNYFKLRMYDPGRSHIHNYLKKKGLDPDQVEAYFNYDAQRDWEVISGSIDTSKCTLFTFAKTYGASNEFDFEMAYIRHDSIGKSDMIIEYDDKILNNGMLKFLFNKKDLQKLPQIKI